MLGAEEPDLAPTAVSNKNSLLAEFDFNILAVDSEPPATKDSSLAHGVESSLKNFESDGACTTGGRKNTA